MMWDIS